MTLPANAHVSATFFGTSSLYFTDGDSGIFIDAFLSRPSLVRVVFGRITPDRGLIAKMLERGGVTVLDAIFTAHSHYDHALDSAEVIKQRGGSLYGSESTLNIGRGAGLGEERLICIADGCEYRFRRFVVRVFEGIHSPGNRYPGIIRKPLTPPARASAYKDGGCYSFLITHPAGSAFVHASANFVPHKFDGVDADVLYLGIGALGAQDDQFRDDYWHHVVEAIGPDVILPVHWDNFGRPITTALRPMPRFMDKFAESRAFLDRKVSKAGPTVQWQNALETITLF